MYPTLGVIIHSIHGYIGVGEVIKKGVKVKRVEVGDLIYYFSKHTSISKIKGSRWLI